MKMRNGYTGRTVRVHLYNGALDIEWAADNDGPCRVDFNQRLSHQLVKAVNLVWQVNGL